MSELPKANSSERDDTYQRNQELTDALAPYVGEWGSVNSVYDTWLEYLKAREGEVNENGILGLTTTDHEEKEVPVWVFRTYGKDVGLWLKLPFREVRVLIKGEPWNSENDPYVLMNSRYNDDRGYTHPLHGIEFDSYGAVKHSYGIGNNLPQEFILLLSVIHNPEKTFNLSSEYQLPEYLA